MTTIRVLLAIGVTTVVGQCGSLTIVARAQLPDDPSTYLHSSQAQLQVLERSTAVPTAKPDSGGPVSDELTGPVSASVQPSSSEQSSLQGFVTDTSGASIPGALITLKGNGSQSARTVTAGSTGNFVFADLEPDTFTVVVEAAGFSSWSSEKITLKAGEEYELPTVHLRAATTADIEVFSSSYELAEEQMHAAEKQRVLGIIPNFYTSYVWNAAPLTTKQKFSLAIRSEIDPASFLGAAFGAGLEQWQDDYSGYGQGAAGYFKRFGASYTDGFDGAMIGSAILPTLFHQDPRYYWKGRGTHRQRALYAISTVVICKGDNGKWETNYSNIIGNFAAGGLSNAYYPAANRGFQLTVVNAILGFASEAIGDLFQEFLLRKVSTGVQP